MSSQYYKILEKEGATTSLNLLEKQKLKEWAQNQEEVFNIFIIFILGQKKEYIIPELLKKQAQGYNFSPYNDPEIFYYKFKPYVVPLGQIYFRDLKEKLQKSDQKTKKKITKKTHQKKSKTKYSNSKSGGFLFMLEDKGDKPITGNDVKEVLDKYGEAMDTLLYTQFGRDPEPGPDGQITDIPNPFAGFYIIMNLSRKKFQSAAQPLLTRIPKILADPTEWYDYYTLYNLYKPEYDKSEKKAYQEAMKKIKSQPDEKLALQAPVEPI